VGAAGRLATTCQFMSFWRTMSDLREQQLDTRLDTDKKYTACEQKRVFSSLAQNQAIFNGIGAVFDRRDTRKSFVVFFLLLFFSFHYFLIFSYGDLKFLKRIPPLFSLPFFSRWGRRKRGGGTP
jgi:hypothetical protein